MSADTALQGALAQAAHEFDRTHIERHADPVQRLPYDLIVTIFDYCQRDLVELTRVSRTWRSCLLQLPIWKALNLDIRSITSDRTFSWQTGLLHYLRPELRQLSVTTDKGIDTVVSALHGIECCKLAKLTIIEKMHPGDDSDPVQHWSECSLFAHLHLSPYTHVFRNLTRLIIQSAYQQRGFLRVLFSLCPQLEHLEQHYLSICELSRLSMDHIFINPSCHQRTRLKCLIWSNIEDICSETYLIITSCPDLVTFGLNENVHIRSPEEYKQALTHAIWLIEGSCHQLNRLVFANDCTLRQEKTQTQGLTDLVCPMSPRLEPYYLGGVLRRHQFTIEYVNVGTGETMETLLSGQLPEHLPRLRRLRLHTGFLMTAQPFERLFTSCTYLQELDLQTSFLSRAMCEALARLPHLHTFKYSYGARDFVMEMTWLVEQWAQAGGSCPLKTLELDGFYFPSWRMHPLIVSMGYVRTLEVLKVAVNQVDSADHNKPSTAQTLADFGHAMQGSGLDKRLRYLALGSIICHNSGAVLNFIERHTNATTHHPNEHGHM